MTKVIRGQLTGRGLSASIIAYLVTAFATPAMAQQDAQPAAGRGDTEEIIVTAQRREERLLDTPLSIGILTGQSLDKSTSRGVSDALNQVGGVFASETQPGATNITIRGVVPDFVGSSPTAFYLDEVPFAFITQGLLPDANAYDLARVEVLRGPQGTLYGANALSGVVRVITNDPNYGKIEVKGRARVASVDGADADYSGDIAVNLPLVDGKLAVRGVASYSKLAGFISSRITPGSSDFNDSEIQSYRVKLGWQPSDDLNIVLGYSRSDIQNDGDNRAFADLTTPYSENIAEKRWYDIYSGTIDYDLGGVSIRSATSYFDYAVRSRIEIPFGAVRLNYANIYDLTSFSQEVRLASKLDGPWQWSAGGIYKNTQQEQTQDARPTLPFPYIVSDKSKSYALFGELTRSLADDRLEITAGLRYFNDKLVSSQASNFTGGTTGVVPRKTFNFDQVTGRFVLSYKPSSDHLVYASVGNGFRSGLAQTPAVVLSDPNFAALQPDKLINYEIGGKGKLADGFLTYDASIYYTRWTEIQQNLITTGGFQARVNAGRATGWGTELALAIHPTSQFTINAAAGWNGLEFREDIFQRVTVGGVSTNVLLFASGQRVNNSPEWTLSLGADYRTPDLLSGVNGIFSVGYIYRSKVDIRSLAGAALNLSSSSTLSDLRASFGLEADRWTFSLFGENLTNRKANILPQTSASLGASLRPRPRRLGAQVTFKY